MAKVELCQHAFLSMLDLYLERFDLWCRAKAHVHQRRRWREVIDGIARKVVSQPDEPGAEMRTGVVYWAMSSRHQP